MSLRPLRILSSLRLTVVLLALSMMLVFMATLAQTRLGIWEVMSRYIRTFVVWVPVGGHDLPVFPGGWLLGGLLLLNLIVAHASRFKWSWKKAPLITIHASLIVLLLSEAITGLFARETQLTLDEGATRSYTEAPRNAELVIVDSSSAERDRVWAIAEKHLSVGKVVEHKTLPFQVKVHHFYQNSRLFMTAPLVEPATPRPTHGVGVNLSVFEQPRVVTTDGRNIVSAIVELIWQGWFGRAVDGVHGAGGAAAIRIPWRHLLDRDAARALLSSLFDSADQVHPRATFWDGNSQSIRESRPADKSADQGGPRSDYLDESAAAIWRRDTLPSQLRQR
jgi:hypothetical protein